MNHRLARNDKGEEAIVIGKGLLEKKRRLLNMRKSSMKTEEFWETLWLPQRTLDFIKVTQWNHWCHRYIIRFKSISCNLDRITFTVLTKPVKEEKDSNLLIFHVLSFSNVNEAFEIYVSSRSFSWGRNYSIGFYHFTIAEGKNQVWLSIG